MPTNPTAYVGVTDYDWYQFLASVPDLDEVNFWKPGGETNFRALKKGEPFLFKLHSPRNVIVGGGFYAGFVKLPISLAWDAFKEKNDLSTSPGGELWAAVAERLAHRVPEVHQGPRVPQVGEQTARYGAPTFYTPRLGQGSFRALVLDAYERRCAISQERTLPVLDAAHIKPYTSEGEHRVDNGLLLRSDVHTLFDKGYITVTPSYTVEVSRRIREEFENGRDYYRFHGHSIILPTRTEDRPNRDFLEWHAATVFRG